MQGDQEVAIFDGKGKEGILSARDLIKHHPTEQLESLYNVVGSVNWYKHFGKLFDSVY